MQNSAGVWDSKVSSTYTNIMVDRSFRHLCCRCVLQTLESCLRIPKFVLFLFTSGRCSSYLINCEYFYGWGWSLSPRDSLVAMIGYSPPGPCPVTRLLSGHRPALGNILWQQFFLVCYDHDHYLYTFRINVNRYFYPFWIFGKSFLGYNWTSDKVWTWNHEAVAANLKK